MVDRLGLIPSLLRPSCGQIDPDGAKWGPPKVAVTVTRLPLIWADGGDGDKLMAGGQDVGGCRLAIMTG